MSRDETVKDAGTRRNGMEPQGLKAATNKSGSRSVLTLFHRYLDTNLPY